MAISINGSTGISGVDGSAGTPAIQGSDTNTGVFFGTNTIDLSTDGTSRLSIDSAGRLLVGTTSEGNANADELTLENSSGAAGITIRAAANFNSNVYFADPGSAIIGRIEYRHNGDTMRFYTFGSEVMRNTSTGELMFNSGYGSVATVFGVRAWINFDGSASTIGTGRGSGNMDAVTDNGSGDYTVNFTNDMPDVNYAVAGLCYETGSTGATDNFIGVKRATNYSDSIKVGSVRVATNGGGDRDIFVMIVR